MIYFIEKDHKWLTEDNKWTSYYTDAKQFDNPLKAGMYAFARGLSGYVITEHDLDIYEDYKHNLLEIAKIYGVTKEMMEIEVKPTTLYSNVKKVSIFQRIKNFFTVITQEDINEAVAEGFKDYVK